MNFHVNFFFLKYLLTELKLIQSPAPSTLFSSRSSDNQTCQLLRLKLSTLLRLGKNYIYMLSEKEVFGADSPEEDAADCFNNH